MKQLPIAIQTEIFKFLNQQISSTEFEVWLYNQEELELYLEEDKYFEIVSINFKDKQARYNFEKIISPHLNHAKYEKSKLIKVLNDLIEKQEKLTENLSKIYELYANGYDFLETIAIDYAYSIEYLTWQLNTGSFLNSLMKKKEINTLYKKVKKEAEKLRFWINEKFIVPTGTKNENGMFQYTDNRTLFNPRIKE